MPSGEPVPVGAHFVRLAAATSAGAEHCAQRLVRSLEERSTTEAVLSVAADCEVSALVCEVDPAVWLVVRGRGDWRKAADAVLEAAGLGTEGHRRLEGREHPGLDGPAAALSPDVAVVAVRHLSDADGAQAVLDLLRRSGRDWKSDFPGFIAATPFLEEDGVTLVNHVRWSAAAAHAAWMADPRMRSGQRDVGAHEAAEPEYHLLRLRAHRRWS